MKTTLSKPVTTFLLAVRGVWGSKPYKVSRRVSTAQKAAEFYVLVKGGEWWTNRGHLCAVMPGNTQGLPDRYECRRQRDDKMMRRVLPIFQKVLP